MLNILELDQCCVKNRSGTMVSVPVAFCRYVWAHIHCEFELLYSNATLSFDNTLMKPYTTLMHCSVCSEFTTP